MGGDGGVSGAGSGPARPSRQSRMIKRAVPTPVEGYAPGPVEVCPDVWCLERRLRHFGFAQLATNTTLVRLRAGAVVMISPPPLLDAATRAAIAELGPVSHVVVPNAFHYLYAEAVMADHPQATLLVPPALAARVPELAGAAVLGEATPEAWRGELEIAALEPAGDVSEVAFFHRASGTVVLTDLAFNMTRHVRGVDALFWRASGVPARFGPGRTTRTLLLADRERARAWLRKIAAWPMQRIVVAHGEPVEHDAAAVFERAFAAELGRD